MSDDFLALFDGCNNISAPASTFDITPNIDFQLINQQLLLDTHILKDSYLFATVDYLAQLKLLAYANFDMPLIIYGQPGTGKLTSLLTMIKYVPEYLQDYKQDAKLNTIYHFKIYNNDWYKLLYLDNVYYLNLNLFLNNTEKLEYLKYIYKISKTQSFDAKRKIFIVKHLDDCTQNIQKYMAFILDHIGAFSSFILIVKSPFNLPHKVKSTCLKLHYPHLNNEEFTSKYVYYMQHMHSTHTASHPVTHTPAQLKLLKGNAIYNIYKNNNYKIGNTLAQIQYINASGRLTAEYLKVKENTESLMQTIVNTFFKKYIVLSTLERLLELRKFIYTLLSINLSTIDFVTLICVKLINSKISLSSKLKILERGCYYTCIYKNANKLVIPFEALLFDIIKIVYC
uniref:Uncharacterized protein n=1 Tax=viral metagenome TaxID=1070528 RepID=A0A6C0HMX2_9ZZZZ